MWIRTLLLCCTSIFFFIALSTPLYAKHIPQHIHKILEDSLSIVEIKHELRRIDKQQQKLRLEQTALSNLVVKQKMLAKQQQVRIDQMICAHYTGEKMHMYWAMLDIKRLQHLFKLYCYYQMMMEQEQNVKKDYSNCIARLQRTVSSMDEKLVELAKLQQYFKQQERKMLSLQQRVEQNIETHDNSSDMRKKIDELTTFWNTTGLAELKRYFRAFAKAMSHFPQFIKKAHGSLSIKNANYTLLIDEQKLRTFLQTEDPMFQDLTFHFKEEGIFLKGYLKPFSIHVKGNYTITNVPVNAMRFHIEEMRFDDLKLPDVTCATMEKQFDLGIYPQKILPFIKATQVTPRKGMLEVLLALSFSKK